MFLSIITVTYNCADTIERTIKSVISQLDSDIEYIIIDGASTDGTKEIIEKYSRYLSCWVSEKDDGVYDAMNKGIKASKGEWVAFINGNDWYLPGVFSEIKKAADEVEHPILYGFVNAIKEGVVDGHVGISAPADRELIHFGNLYCHQGLFIKRDLFDQIGLYDTNYKIYADHDWNIKAHEAGYDPYFMDFTVANYTMDGISSQSSEADEDQRVIISHMKNHHPFSEELERRIGRAEFVLLKRHFPEFLKEILAETENIFMWGNGFNGRECLELLKKNNVSPVGIIVSTPVEKTWNGVDVLSPKQFFDLINMNHMSSYKVLVASDRYEDEIARVLENSYIHASNYVKMTDIYKWASLNYERCCCSNSNL